MTIYPKVELDQMSLLAEENFAVVPILVAKKLKNGTMNICQLEAGPEDMMIYGLTSGDRKKEMIHHFLHLLQEELSQIPEVHSFLH